MLNWAPVYAKKTFPTLLHYCQQPGLFKQGRIEDWSDIQVTFFFQWAWSLVSVNCITFYVFRIQNRKLVRNYIFSPRHKTAHDVMLSDTHCYIIATPASSQRFTTKFWQFPKNLISDYDRHLKATKMRPALMWKIKKEKKNKARERISQKWSIT